ncbi:hypothetical protein Ancab_003684 [Ancistrocladus abbreviatus]
MNISGSCYLPRPDKEDTGEEDAHFICTNEQVIRIADGIGGWQILKGRRKSKLREVHGSSSASKKR